MRHKILPILLAFVLLLSGCGAIPSEEDQIYTDTLFDTVVRIEIREPADKVEDSEIFRINNAGGNPVEVSAETVKLIKKALYYSDLSNGVFDITIAPVSELWDFHAEEPVVPAPEAVTGAVGHVDYKNILIKDNTVQLLDPLARIDVGGIAKGYIADRVKEYLKEEGVKHAVIDLGGNVLTIGGRPDGSDYNIGIQKPFDTTGTPVTSVRISDKSIVTSGIYQRYFEVDGKKYHHILDPRTGYPCENNLYSVTIITESSLTADALSTTCFLLGFDKGMRLISQLDNVDGVFITNDNKIHYSKNFQHKMKN